MSDDTGGKMNDDEDKASAAGAEPAEDASDETTSGKAEDKLVHLRPPRPCPSCGKPSTRKAYPFCSSRCADVDLNRWLTGKFVIPGRTLTDTDEDEADGFGGPVNTQNDPD